MWAQLFNPLFPVYKFALILMLPLADFPVQINLFTEVTTYVTNNKQVLKHAFIIRPHTLFTISFDSCVAFIKTGSCGTVQV